MRMQLAGTTFDFNVKSNVYYDKVERGFRTHQYLGLYKNKSVRAIGKVCAIIRAVEENGSIRFTNEMGELTAERKQIIEKAMNDAITSATMSIDISSLKNSTRQIFRRYHLEVAWGRGFLT